MHEDQVDITAQQVAGLVAEQIPELAGMEVVRVRGSGTVRTIFRTTLTRLVDALSPK